MELKEIGFKNWFIEKLAECKSLEDNIARVVSVNKDNFLIRNKEKELLAEVTGKIRYGAESNLDFPAVGDWVQVHYFNDNDFAIIHSILPRKSLLKRKVAGKKIEYQLIAANIDVAFIMQSLDLNFNIPRLERYLIMAHEGSIDPIILLSKKDLITPDELGQRLSEIESMNHHYKIIAFSNESGEGLDEIRSTMIAGDTYCLLGSSGVGKTTLLNRLIGENLYATNSVREKDCRGRHVTARRQLIILDKGGLIIDTPGMRELGNIEIQTGLDKTFIEIQKLGETCRFKNCTHINEPGCAVLNAVANGELREEHHNNYMKLRKESEYYEMSYLEKRKKDKKFGKLCKDFMKHKKRSDL